jgi:predicted O-methyltransferase YrrM
MFRNLRLVQTDKLYEYRANTELFFRVGNAEFGKVMKSGIERSEPSPYQAPWQLYHSWRDFRVLIDDESASIIQDLMAERPTGPKHDPTIKKLKELGFCDDDLPVDLDELVKRTQTSFIAIQNEYELRAFLEIVQKRRPKTVVEIGTARGGVLYCLSQLAAPDATLVSIDLPGAPNCGGQTETEREVFATFGPMTQNFHFIPQDSQLESSRERLTEILNGRKVDLLFIDGDHTYEGCLADFNGYKHFVSEDGLIVFHDICVFPDVFPGSAVGVVWQELSSKYGGMEIIDPDGVSKAQLEPGERWRWGIGIFEASQCL